VAAITSTLDDGNVRAAARILCSDECLAPDSEQIVEKVRERRPAVAGDMKSIPDPGGYPPVSVSEADVALAIRSFPAGSAGGPDHFKLQHLRDLTSCVETGPAWLTAITLLVNLLLEGNCPPAVKRVLCSGNLIAFLKKSGGIRLIAVGYTLRRLAAKCATRCALQAVGESLLPCQLGAGIPGGCEAAVHPTRRFIADMPDDFVVAKLDFCNAFNSMR
jgi:hypothetical protein